MVFQCTLRISGLGPVVRAEHDQSVLQFIVFLEQGHDLAHDAVQFLGLVTVQAGPAALDEGINGQAGTVNGRGGHVQEKGLLGCGTLFLQPGPGPGPEDLIQVLGHIVV